MARAYVKTHRHPLHKLERTQVIQAPLPQTFDFFANASHLEVITPTFLNFQIRSTLPIVMRTGTQIEYSLSLFHIPIHWRTRITEWTPGTRFIDEQEHGPFSFWRHTHEFESHGTATMVRDLVEYKEPLGLLGQAAHAIWVERTLQKIFDFRHDQVRDLLERSTSGP